MLRRPLVTLALAALAVAGCDRARPRADGAAAAGGGIDSELAVCTSCHGDPANGNAAPPRSVRGLTDPAQLAVGAHQAHLRGGTTRAPIACSECHVVPASAGEPGHGTGSVAAVTFGPLATSGGTPASWDRVGATCATYCHGATLAGGLAKAPVWTRVDGSQAACDSCHGLPPPPSSGHPAARADPAACAACHPATVLPDGRIDVAGGKHIDGNVDLGATGCTSCHGDPAASNAAPPRGTQGETATTTRAVGAHQTHLNAGAVALPIACTECHVVPTSTSHSNGTVTVTFGALAQTGGAVPTWNGATCASTYCHGANIANGGGTITAPTWTKVDGTQAACGTCHGLPPPAAQGHPTVTGGLTACVSCHPATMNADGTLNVAGGKHVDGIVEAAGGTCTSCHGDATRATNPAAPPKGTKGETLTTARAVGAHQTHLNTGTMRGPINCSECHVVPTSTSHSNGTVTVTFGPLANTGTASSWSGATCTTYCHGATLTGGTLNTPTWTAVDGTQASCGTCHRISPQTGQHQRSEHVGRACGVCHPGYATTATNNGVTVNPAVHVNGTKDVGGAGTSINTWNASTRSCSPSCHGNQTW
jgi:predicted CxxxxCH...CXXCH cytochrome family protein